MSSRSKRKWMGLLLVFFVWIICLSPPFQAFAALPDELRFFSGQHKSLNLAMPVGAQMTVQNPEIIHVNGKAEHSFQLNLKQPIALQSGHSGKTEMRLKLFGKIPLKTVQVNVIPDLKVIPGGQTIGVKLKSAGILVVGHHTVTVQNQQKVSPAEQADIRLGDLITHVNGNFLNDVGKMSELIEQAGKNKQALKLEIIRSGKKVEKEMLPVFDAEDRAYRLGLYIRDSAAGVGPLTFYSPEHDTYGALGHVITDMDTQTPIIAGGGEIMNSSVTSISKSQNGIPGEKRAHLFEEDHVLGTIEKNTDFGIFGKMYKQPDHAEINKAIPVALAEEVRPGPAQILTVINGQKVEKFDIEIIHVSKQEYPATKGMVLKITDPRLLQKTGGIVQGMSGSPIIQNGKLVGAVTHVFVNDPSSGYGCFIEWMLQDAGIMLKNGQQDLKAS